jgi:hypothetical protein
MTVIRSRAPAVHPRRDHDAHSRSPALESDDASSAAGHQRWSEDRTSAPVGLMAAVGAGLLVASELADRLEVDLGLSVIGLTLSMLLAVLIVSTGALLGDSLLRAVETRSGRRPSPRLVTSLLTVSGGPTVVWILIRHLSHPLALDGCLGLAGGLLLALTALAHHQLTPTKRR